MTAEVLFYAAAGVVIAYLIMLFMALLEGFAKGEIQILSHDEVMAVMKWSLLPLLLLLYYSPCDQCGERWKETPHQTFSGDQVCDDCRDDCDGPILSFGGGDSDV